MMDLSHYDYSPLSKAELIMVAYNTIAPPDTPKLSLEEAGEVIDQNTSLVNCLGKVVQSEITSIASINNVDFRCEIRRFESDISQLVSLDHIVCALEERKRSNYPGWAFLKEKGIAKQIQELGRDR